MATWAHIWTDGSASDGSASQSGRAKGPGAWAFIAVESGAAETGRSCFVPDTTNQRMEMNAVISALYWAVDEACVDIAEIHCDSAYVVNCINEKWYHRWWINGWLNSAKKPVANQDLWEDLLTAYFQCQQYGVEIRMAKVAGHADDRMNNRVDALASETRRRGQKREGIAV